MHVGKICAMSGKPGQLVEQSLQLRCLVVDPSPASRLILERFLGGVVEGIEGVGYVQDASRVLFGPQKPGVVLAAWEQAELSGLEFARFVSRTTDVPIILISSEVSKERAQQAREAGAASLLVRPFTRTQLFDAVSEVARRGVSGVAPRRQTLRRL